jgi:hypothetical protein
VTRGAPLACVCEPGIGLLLDESRSGFGADIWRVFWALFRMVEKYVSGGLGGGGGGEGLLRCPRESLRWEGGTYLGSGTTLTRLFCCKATSMCLFALTCAGSYVAKEVGYQTTVDPFVCKSSHKHVQEADNLITL